MSRTAPRRCFSIRASLGDTMTTRRKKIYEGKAKILYEGPEPGTLIQYFKDDATALQPPSIASLTMFAGSK